MDDTKYTMIETIRERKDLARSARHKKNGSKSKKCTLPSDYLTKKEKEAMSSECKTWSMFKFYNWEEFQEMPADIQVQYLNSIIYRYGVGICTISKHQFKKSPSNLDKYLTAHGIKSAIKHTSPGTGPAVKKNLSRYLEAIEKQNRVEMAHSEPEATVDIPEEEPVESALDFSRNPDGEFVDKALITNMVSDEAIPSFTKATMDTKEYYAAINDAIYDKPDIPQKQDSKLVGLTLNMENGFDFELVDYLLRTRFKGKTIQVGLSIFETK